MKTTLDANNDLGTDMSREDINDYRKISTFSDEKNIMEVFRKLFPRSIKFCPDNHKVHFTRLINSIINDKHWERWTDNSKESGKPPDFYNNSEKFMLEVMRIDHYMFTDEKGKPHNKNAENISKIVRSLMDEGRNDILDNYIITGAVELETEESPYCYD